MRRLEPNTGALSTQRQLTRALKVRSTAGLHPRSLYRRPQAALRLIEGVRIILEYLYLLDQPGDVTGEAVVLDCDRRLPEMVAVLDPSRDEGRLGRVVEERHGGKVQGQKRCRVEQRLNARIALRDVDDVPMDIIDRPSDKLSEIGSQDERAGRRVRVFDRGNFLVELIDHDVRVQIGEVVTLRLDHGEDSLAEMHEINVTPFIDVMLVLLIIFMVASPARHC